MSVVLCPHNGIFTVDDRDTTVRLDAVIATFDMILSGNVDRGVSRDIQGDMFSLERIAARQIQGRIPCIQQLIIGSSIVNVLSRISETPLKKLI